MGGSGIKTGIFLQVRINSTRLSRKALLPLMDGNVIQHAMRALLKVKTDVYILLTDECSAPSLKEFAESEGFNLFVGPSNDVLKRYCLAAEYFSVDQIIRATGDNPLVSSRLANDIISIHNNANADLSHFIGIPIGTGIEIVRRSALQKSEKESTDPFEREHLTTHIYRNKEKFKIIEEKCSIDFFMPDIKVSIDTEEDYNLILKIYQDLYDSKPISIEKIIRWFKKGKEINSAKENSFCTSIEYGSWDRTYQKMPNHHK